MASFGAASLDPFLASFAFPPRSTGALAKVALAMRPTVAERARAHDLSATVATLPLGIAKATAEHAHSSWRRDLARAPGGVQIGASAIIGALLRADYDALALEPIIPRLTVAATIVAEATAGASVSAVTASSAFCVYLYTFGCAAVLA